MVRILLSLSGVLVSLISLAQEISKTEEWLSTEFLTAKSGDTIYIPAGNFRIQRTLWLDNGDNIVIKGAGNENTILDFKDQIDGAEGLKVTNSRNVVIQGIQVKNTTGDAIKVQDTKDVSFKEVKVTWDGKPRPENGAYGIYPVLCQRVIVDDCEVSGASDAGIYVGQSDSIVVMNSLAHHNVAGIEIENSTRAEVKNNITRQNTGGILVFDLPDLTKKKGGNVMVHHNEVFDNNLFNFAPKGNIVGKVPRGTGILILATSNVSVFENIIKNNQSVGTGIISYFMTENPINDSQYDPYPNDINIYSNTYERLPTRATSKGRFGKMFKYKLKLGKDVPHIMWDGIVPADGIRLCIMNNSGQSFLKLDAGNDFQNMERDNLDKLCPVK